MRGTAVLCYVRLPFLWFTTAPLDKQWGDDWNDAPYEHNAGPPYEQQEGALYTIYVLATLTDLEEPSSGLQNSPWSVEQINAGHVPWLRADRWSKSPCNIAAGETYEAVRQKLLARGSRVFEEVRTKENP